MKFKDNDLIWEAYQPNVYAQDEQEQGMDVGPDTLGVEDPSAVVMEFEPMGEVETFEDDKDELHVAVYVEIKKLAEYSNRILEVCKEVELRPWMQAQLVKASTYVSDVWHRLDVEADFANTGFEQSDNIDL